MAVFTDLTREETIALLDRYRLGDLIDIRGIASGIENTNFFLDTELGHFVLTVFERLRADQLPFYLGLMKHLAQRELPVPEPFETVDGELSAAIRGKPAAIVARMPGKALESPGPYQCAQVGEFLARMHLEAADYPLSQPNPRGLDWWKQAVVSLQAHVPADTFRDLNNEVRYQDEVARGPEFASLPAGPMHADLFRDNVLFDGETIGGVIDFYFAGCGPWLFDLAVTANDWCVDLQTGEFLPARIGALLRAYDRLRPLSGVEHRHWQAMLRAAALRFWISRLYDQYLPRPASVLRPHDPSRFGRMLQLRVQDPEPPWA